MLRDPPPRPSIDRAISVGINLLSEVLTEIFDQNFCDKQSLIDVKHFLADQPAVGAFNGTFWCNSPVTRYAFCKNFLYFCTAFGMDKFPKK